MRMRKSRQLIFAGMGLMCLAGAVIVFCPSILTIRLSLTLAALGIFSTLTGFLFSDMEKLRHKTEEDGQRHTGRSRACGLLAETFGKRRRF